jgi:hypothetical protein
MKVDSPTPLATLPQEFMSAMPPKADKPEPTRMTHTGHRCQDSLKRLSIGSVRFRVGARTRVRGRFSQSVGDTPLLELRTHRQPCAPVPCGFAS